MEIVFFLWDLYSITSLCFVFAVVLTRSLNKKEEKEKNLKNRKILQLNGFKVAIENELFSTLLDK